MNIPKNIYKQPSFYKFIPWLKRHKAGTIGYVVFIRPDIFEDLKKDNPTPESVSVLLHEQEHLKNAREIGLIKFGLRYLLSGKGRFNEELSANKAAFKYLKDKNVTVDLEKKARILSSWLYWWPVKNDFALKEVKKAWEEA